MSSTSLKGLTTSLVFGAGLLCGCSGGAGSLPTTAGAHPSGVRLPAEGARPNVGPSFVLIPGYTSPFIASDLQGGEWFQSFGSITRLDEQTYGGQGYPVTQFIDGFALGRNKGSMWFVSGTSDQVGRISLSSRQIYWYNLPSGSYPTSITAGSDNAMWFTEGKRARIGRISAKDFSITEYRITSGDEPYDITLGPDGALWFTTTDSMIGRISESTHNVTEYSDGGDPFNITSGPDGALWYTDDGYKRIGRIDPSSHAISHFAPKGKSITPAFIITRDSYLWFTDKNGRIGRFSPSTHHFTLYNVPTQGAAPFGLALGKDDELWFGEENENEIVKMCPELGPTECSTTSP